MTVKEIIGKVRLNLGNPSQQIVPDAEILNYLNNAQYDIVKEGQVLRGSATLNTVADKERYPIPDAAISILRVDYDGQKIELVDYDRIDELDVS